MQWQGTLGWNLRLLCHACLSFFAPVPKRGKARCVDSGTIPKHHQGLFVVSFILFLALSLSLWFSRTVLIFPGSLTLSISLSLALSLSRFLALSFSRSLALSLSRSIALLLSCSLALSFSRFLALSPPPSLVIRLSQSLALSLSLPLFLALLCLLVCARAPSPSLAQESLFQTLALFLNHLLYCSHTCSLTTAFVRSLVCSCSLRARVFPLCVPLFLPPFLSLALFFFLPAAP